MKKLLTTTFVLFSILGFSQKIALLSNDFKTPILYTDSLTIEQVSSGRFAVSVDDLDTLVASFAYLKDLLKDLTRSKLESWEFRSGKSVIKTVRMPKAYGDRYEIVVMSKFDEITSIFDVSTEKTNKKNSDRIEKILKYIEKNRTVLREWYEITPKMYEVIVVKG
jgi:hypothetical protein